jgi:hypothetical protein
MCALNNCKANLPDNSTLRKSKMNNAQTLYDSLFQTLQEVKSGKMPVEQAKAITQVSQTILNVARVEIDYAAQTKNASKSAFFSDGVKTINQKPEVDDISKPATYNIGTGKVEHIGNVTRHTMK